jgi:hypothetical protein
MRAVLVIALLALLSASAMAKVRGMYSVQCACPSWCSVVVVVKIAWADSWNSPVAVFGVFDGIAAGMCM